MPPHQPELGHIMSRYSPLKRSSLIPVLLLALGWAGIAQAEKLWQSGKNQYVKLVERDDSLADTPPNQHPAQLDAQQLRLALEQLQFRQDKLFAEEEIYPVFSAVQRRTLAQLAVEGLAQAREDQELIFALAGKSGDPDSAFSFQGSLFTAGRIFYLDDHLHLIFGDFRRPRDRGDESMAGQFGEYEIRYRFRHGERAGGGRGVYAMEQPLLQAQGVENQRLDGKKRLDWLVIDLQVAADSVLEEARREKSNTPTAKALDGATKERLEMRAEMARMRKELRALSEAPGDTGADLKQRISTLENLRRDGMITEQEYQRKRSEILDDI